MRRTGSVTVALCALALAACSKHDESRTTSDLKDAAHSIDRAASGVAHDPNLKAAGADLRDIGHDAGQSLRKGAAETQAATHSVVDDSKNAAHRAGEKVDHHDDSGDRNSDNGN